MSNATLGIVIELEDSAPSNKNRVKVRIPSIHGPMKESDIPAEWSHTMWTDDDHLPWIPICFPLGTASPDKSLLKEKEIVYIMYTGANNSAPVIIGTAAQQVKE